LHTEEENAATKPGVQIGKIAFAIIGIAAMVISSVGCGTLIGSLIGYAIAGGGMAKGPAPVSVNISLVIALVITVLFAFGLTALVLSNVKFADDESTNKTITRCLIFEQVVLTAALVTAMALGGAASLANPGPRTGPPAIAGPGQPKPPAAKPPSH
jgi:hypothetical protein